MGDCEHGKLAVTTSKIFSKIYENLQIPTHYCNVTFNFQGTDFVKKAVQIPLFNPTSFLTPKTPLEPPLLTHQTLTTHKHCTFFIPVSGHPAIDATCAVLLAFLFAARPPGASRSRWLALPPLLQLPPQHPRGRGLALPRLPIPDRRFQRSPPKRPPTTTKPPLCDWQALSFPM